MDQLGFLMDMDGNIHYFGKWVADITHAEKSRHYNHTDSFIDEVENTPYFQSLGLEYEKESGLYGKGIQFSLQGMILLLNHSIEYLDQHESKIMMWAPKNLSNPQKQKLMELYPLLASFEEVAIRVPISYFDFQDYDSLEKFFEINGLNYNKITR